MPTTASTRDLLRWRLVAQQVSPRATGSVADLAAGMLAIQAQDFAQGLWAIGTRTSATRAEIVTALDRGEIVRSWPMRGTLHLLRASDLRWMLGLTAARTTQSLTTRHRDLGLDAETFTRAADVTVKALSGGRSLGRVEYLRVLADAGIRIDGQAGPHLIGQLARDRLVLWGPSHSTQQALVLFDEWSPPSGSEPIRDEALAMFVTGYLRAHGPATTRDFAWWSGVTLTDARVGFAAVASELEAVEVGGTEFWMLAESARPSAGGSGVHLLAGFDEFLLGYQDRSHPLAAGDFERVVPGANGIFLATIVSRGRIVGTWRRSVGKSAVSVTVDPFEPLSQIALAGVEREVARFGRFHGLPTRLV